MSAGERTPRLGTVRRAVRLDVLLEGLSRSILGRFPGKRLSGSPCESHHPRGRPLAPTAFRFLDHHRAPAWRRPCRCPLGNGLGGRVPLFGEMGTRPKSVGFGRVVPAPVCDGLFAGIFLTRRRFGLDNPGAERGGLTPGDPERDDSWW